MDSAERPLNRATGTANSRPRARKSADAKRHKIVRSAAKLFLEKGYDSVSINDIILVAGGSKETIYSNFGSKEKLFEAVVEQMCEDVTVRIDARPIGTLEEQLTRIAHSFVSRVLSPQTLSFHRLMTSIGHTFPSAAQQFYNTGPQMAYKIIADWIAFHQQAGNIRSDEAPYRLAVLFHDMLIGDQQLSWLTSAASEKNRLKRIEQTVQLAIAVFLQGTATRRPAKRNIP